MRLSAQGWSLIRCLDISSLSPVFCKIVLRNLSTSYGKVIIFIDVKAFLMEKEIQISLKDLIETIGVSVLIFNTSLTLECFNESAKKLIPDLKEKSAAEAIFNSKRISSQILECLKTGKTEFRRIRYKTNEGTEVAVNIKLLELEGDNLAIVTLNDLSPLSEAKMMRSDFVSNVSHEIRSPLTSIIGFVETLQGPAGDDINKREKFLEIISKEASRMTNLVSDLLSLSLVEAKEKRKVKGRVNPEEIVRLAFESLKPEAKKKGKEIKIKLAKDIPEIPGHHDNLLRVLINLIENSINYSRDKSVITISMKRISEEAEFLTPGVKITVSDKSDGISPEEIPRLTERFYRVDRSRSRDMGGTGLGLAIVKHILVRHRGKLSIDSVLGKGSDFSIYLPLT